MNRYVVVPHNGAGRARLVRQGRTVLFTTGEGPGAAALTGWCRLFGDRSSSEILQELGRVTSDNPTLGAFVLLVLDDDAVEVAVSGALPVAAHGPTGIEVLQPGSGFVQRRVDAASVIALTVPGAVVDPLLELERGIIAADGFEVRISRPTTAGSPWSPPASAAPAAPVTPSDLTGEVPRPAVEIVTPVAAPPAAAPSPPPAPPAPAVTPDIVFLGAPDTDMPDAVPLPVAGQPAPEAPPASPPPSPGHEHAEAASGAPSDSNEVRVRGLQCARSHFNDPRARYCGVCGIAMHQASFILVEDVRPPLGVLVFGDGSYQTLARTAIVGRDPSDDAAVRAGTAISLPLTDPTNTLSRVHAEVRLLDWDVQIVDRGSTNGTFVWAPGQVSWERLAANQPRTLQPGTHVSFGRLTATFESSQRQS